MTEALPHRTFTQTDRKSEQHVPPTTTCQLSRDFIISSEAQFSLAPISFILQNNTWSMMCITELLLPTDSFSE